MKCPICGGTGNTKNIIGKPQTEQEYIQTCTTEQLAEFLITSIKKCKSCASGIGIDEVQHCPFGECGCHFKDEVVKWLKQPHSWWEK